MSLLDRNPVTGSSHKRLAIGFAICLAIYALMKILMLPGINIINPFYLGVVQKICIDAILALGLNLITGITGQFSLGHAGFMAIGAYTAGLLVRLMTVNTASILILCASAMIMGGLFGLLIAIPTLRLKGDYLAIATLGFAEIIRIVIQNVDQSIFGGSAGLSALPRYTSFEWVFFGLVFSFVICRNFVNSTYGRACISVREDEVAAEAMGVPLTKTKLTAFVIGTMLAGLAGALYTGNVGYIAPKDFGFLKSIDILMIVVIGGLGNIWGCLGAAVLINIVSMWLQDFEELRMVLYALALVIIMLVKSGETPFFVNARAITAKVFAFLNPRRFMRRSPKA